MRQIDIIWLAGLLEGEGCFNVRPEKNGQARVSIEMTDKDIVERVSRLFDSNISTRAPRVLGKCNVCKPGEQCDIPADYRRGHVGREYLEEFGYTFSQESYQTAIYGERAKNLMRLVFPFMGNRRSAKVVEILGTLL